MEAQNELTFTAPGTSQVCDERAAVTDVPVFGVFQRVIGTSRSALLTRPHDVRCIFGTSSATWQSDEWMARFYLIYVALL